MSYIAVLPGDGIGPEVINEAIKIIKSVASFLALFLCATNSVF